MIEEYFCRTCGVDWKTMNEKNINEFTDNLVFVLYMYVMVISRKNGFQIQSHRDADINSHSKCNRNFHLVCLAFISE